MSDILERFAPLFRPKTVAVVGASSTGGGRQNVFIRRLKNFGYEGKIYPIHPTAAEIDGIKAYPSLSETPEPIDYANIAVAAAQIPGMLTAAKGRLRFAQVISSGFGESEGGASLEKELVRAAHEAGIRVLGPNCVGMYSAAGRMTMTETKPQPAGCVSVVTQSGGLGVDIVRRGLNRGLQYGSVVTLGNCADLGITDFVEYYLADEATRVIGLYMESAREGRRLFELLRTHGAKKPVVILNGGRTPEGNAAAASHTGALAAPSKTWQALARQTGCVLVKSLDELLDVMLAFQVLQPNVDAPTDRVVLFGNGGGTSVLATDYLSELGLRVLPFGAETKAALSSIKLPPGSSATNPIDIPGGNFRKDGGAAATAILDAVYRLDQPQALVMHLNMTVFKGHANNGTLDALVQAALKVKSSYPGKSHFLLVLRSDGDPEIDEQRRAFRVRATEVGIPVFDELTNASHALAAMSRVERFRCSRSG